VDLVDLNGTALGSIATPQNPYGGAYDYVFEPAFLSDGRLLVAVAYFRLWLMDPVEGGTTYYYDSRGSLLAKEYHRTDPRGAWIDPGSCDPPLSRPPYEIARDYSAFIRTRMRGLPVVPG
jgi:hypothetical protein